MKLGNMSEKPLISKRKICNHTSVGVILKNSTGRILLIDRKIFPLFFASPAGHLKDGENPEIGAKREVEEEVGLVISNLKLALNERFENPCCREDGNWHEWWVYEADYEGELKPSERETKKVGWCNIAEIEKLSEEGKLEPVWQEIFQKLKIL